MRHKRIWRRALISVAGLTLAAALAMLLSFALPAAAQSPRTEVLPNSSAQRNQMIAELKQMNRTLGEIRELLKEMHAQQAATESKSRPAAPSGKSGPKP